MRFFFLIYILKKQLFTLAGVAQLAGHCPANQKVPGLIPSEGTCLGCCFIPWVRACATGNRWMVLSHQCFSPSSSLPSPF